MRLLLIHSLMAFVLPAVMSFASCKCQPTATTISSIDSTELSTGIVVPSDPNIKYVGRISFKDPNAPCFGFTGAQIYANFTGTSVKMRMKPNSGFFAIVIDGEEPIMVQSKKDTLVDIKSGLKDTTHSLVINQCTEAVDVDFPVFYGLQLDKGAHLSAAPELPTRKIEFIGNSITCGKGARDTSKLKDRDDIAYEDWYISYDADVARRLNAQCMVIARSGIGIYRNNGGKRTGDEYNMQYYFPRTLLKPDSEMWDFKRYTPDLVCINLGTNDTSQSYDLEKYKQGAKKFLEEVRKCYHKATIVVMTGPMRSGKRLIDQKTGLDYAVDQLKKSGDKKVYRFDFPVDNGKYGYGTGHHPSVGEHRYMADLLTKYLKHIMNW